MLNVSHECLFETESVNSVAGVILDYWYNCVFDLFNDASGETCNERSEFQVFFWTQKLMWFWTIVSSFLCLSDIVFEESKTQVVQNS